VWLPADRPAFVQNTLVSAPDKAVTGQNILAQCRKARKVKRMLLI
jgi:hypothetical protein